MDALFAGMYKLSHHLVNSSRGSCIGTDQCACNDGWMGMDCSITHCFGVTSNLPDRVCSGKGKCVRPNKCHCDDGFGGHKCQIPLVQQLLFSAFLKPGDCDRHTSGEKSELQINGPGCRTHTTESKVGDSEVS